MKTRHCDLSQAHCSSSRSLLSSPLADAAPPRIYAATLQTGGAGEIGIDGRWPNMLNAEACSAARAWPRKKEEGRS